MEGRTNGGFVYHTECALWTPQHHVRLGTEHVEYIMLDNNLPLCQQKHLHVSYMLMPLNVNKTITIHLTSLTKAAKRAQRGISLSNIFYILHILCWVLGDIKVTG